MHLVSGKKIYRKEQSSHDFAQELRKNKEELARKVTQEMGKAIIIIITQITGRSSQQMK